MKKVLSEVLSKSDQAKFARAQQLSKAGNTEATLRITQQLVLSNPDSGILRAMLANTYRTLAM